MTLPTLVYALLIVVFTKDGPATIAKLYDNEFNCQVAETAMMTKMRHDKDIIGWVVPTECTPVQEVRHI